MFRFLKSHALVAVILLSVTGSAVASSLSGRVNGTNTIDYWLFTATQGDTVDYSASASGNGNNELTVKVQQMRSNGTWRTIDDIKVSVGATSSASFVVGDEFAGTTEQLRYRISRKIGTRAIDYTLNDDL